MSEPDSHVAEARSWLSIYEDAETDEERWGAIKHAHAAIENAEREVRQDDE